MLTIILFPFLSFGSQWMKSFKSQIKDCRLSQLNSGIRYLLILLSTSELLNCCELLSPRNLFMSKVVVLSHWYFSKYSVYYCFEFYFNVKSWVAITVITRRFVVCLLANFINRVLISWRLITKYSLFVLFKLVQKSASELKVRSRGWRRG